MGGDFRYLCWIDLRFLLLMCKFMTSFMNYLK